MPTALKVVMFTDQVKSPLHTARRTSAEIVQVNRAQTDVTAEAVRLCHGIILKDTGDGVFIEFPACTDANDFFDRRNEQRTLRTYVCGRQNCQIVGPRAASDGAFAVPMLERWVREQRRDR